MPQLSLKAILLGSPSRYALSAAFVPLPLHVIKAKMAKLREMRGELDALAMSSGGELVIVEAKSGGKIVGSNG